MQGVGFRPFIYRLAHECGLGGWVRNDSAGLAIEVEGPEPQVQDFVDRLARERPAHAIIHRTTIRPQPPTGNAPFVILPSAHRPEHTTFVLSDLAPCDACLEDVLDPANRRYRYPFTNCTYCGPRFSIVERLPYDRAQTTMRVFPLCPDCQREYDDPLDRRFHAQPNACPRCGPQLSWTSRAGETLAERDAALEAAAAALQQGHIVAVKGQGGFHLMVDATNDAAIARLRERKARQAKPLALMVRDLAMAEQLCTVTAAAALHMRSALCPILLLPRRADAPISALVAGNNPRLGIMLPPTPLHHLLMRDVARPLVATSGNISDEPICTGNEEAYDRLGSIADGFLVHNRHIAHHLDDSVMTLIDELPQMLRRARGAAPQPITLQHELPCILALGADGKNTVALSLGRHVIVSQHVGDLDQVAGLQVLERVVGDLLTLHDARPQAIAHDLHPGYHSTRWLTNVTRTAASAGAGTWRARLAHVPLVSVQHHHAHLSACLAEHHCDAPALGIIWDGTGYAPDGTIWGGEFLDGDAGHFQRVAHLRPFALLGGEAAVRDTRRIGLALLHATLGEATWATPLAAQFSATEQHVFRQLLTSSRHTTWTSSMGRLFDGVAALLGLATHSAYEGQAAMAVEWAAEPAELGRYGWQLDRPANAPWQLDWRPLIQALVTDFAAGRTAPVLAARFHHTLVAMLLGVAAAWHAAPQAVAAEHGSGSVEVAKPAEPPLVVLSGGCFQNQLLAEHARQRLARAGFTVLQPQALPANDGGLSLGQIAVAARWLERRRATSPTIP